MTAQEILSQENVNIETVLAKYTADILWSNTLRIRFARQFASLDKNAEKEQQKIKQSFSEPQIKLSEIILLATPQRNLEQTQAMAQEIVKAARQGASFPVLPSNIPPQALPTVGVMWAGYLLSVCLMRSNPPLWRKGRGYS